MSSIPVAGLAKALILVTVPLHPGAAHHDPGQLHPSGPATPCPRSRPAYGNARG